MKKLNLLKPLCFFCVILSCMLLPLTAKAATEGEYQVPDGEDISYMLSNPNFSLYTLPDGLYDNNIADEILPGGILLYSYNGYTDTSNLYGLMDSNGKILLQPRYTEIKPLNINYLFDKHTEGVDTSFPNLLILVDENDRYSLFDCRTKEIIGDSYDKIGIDETSAYSQQGKYNLFEYFIPVYNEGEGYGMLNLEGELIIPCEYGGYDLKHPRRMAMHVSDSTGRTLQEHLYAEMGDLLNSSCSSINMYHNGMAAASKPDPSDPEMYVDGYLDFYGNWAFTLGENYNWISDGYSGNCEFSQEGLVQIRYYDEERDTSYPVFMNNRGEIVISLVWVYDEHLRDLSWPYEGAMGVSDFHDGMALITVDIERNITTYDHSVQYILYSDGSSKMLTSGAYYVEKNGCILAKENKDAVGYINVFGKWGFNVLPDGNYSVDFCCIYGDCQWLEIIDNTTGFCAYLSLAEWRMTDFLYLPSSGSCHNYLGEEYLSVKRDGKVGVLGSNAKELVPCEYKSVVCPVGFEAYFRALSDPYYYCTLYSLEGELISKHDQFSNFYSHDNRYGAVGCARATDRDLWKPAIIDNTGNITIAYGEGSYTVHSPFTSDLAYATHSYSKGDEWVSESGFLNTDGNFMSLSYVGHEFCDNFTIGFDPELPYGVCILKHEHLDSADDLPHYEYYLLRYNNYIFTDWYDTSTSTSSSPFVVVESITPTNGAVGIDENTKYIEIKFNQEILLQEDASIRISCPLNTPDYYVSCSGDTLRINFYEPLELGEKYTIELDSLAVMSAYSEVSYFEGFTSSFKVFGLSTEELLTKYPQYLVTPSDIVIKIDNALCAVNNAMDRFAGENNISAYIASLFYSTQNYHKIISYEIMGAFGGGGFDDTLWEDILQTFISQTCLKNEHKYKQMNQLTGSELHNFIYMFNVKKTQEELVDQLRDFVDDANFDISDQELDAIAEGFKKLAYEPDFLKLYLDITGDFSDVAGEFAATFLTYYYLNRDAAETLMRYLPETSELYCGLKAHVDAMTKGDAFTFMMNKLLDDSFSSFMKIGMKELGKYDAELWGTTTALKSVNLCTDIAYIMYTAVSPRAEITEYIKTIMFSSYVFALDAAQNDVLSEMMRSVQKDGTTTAQQREDFNAIYCAHQAAWMMLLDQASALFKEEDNYFYTECMDAKAILAAECNYTSFIKACKKAVPSNVVRGILAQQSNGNSTTVTGFLPAPRPFSTSLYTVDTSRESDDIVSANLSMYSTNLAAQSTDEEVYIETLEELMPWMGYTAETEEDFSRSFYITGNLAISIPGSYAFPEAGALYICEGASLTICAGVTCSIDTFTAVYGSLINSGVLDAYGFIGVFASESGSSNHGSLYNHGTLTTHDWLSADVFTTVVNDGEIIVNDYCVISGTFEGTDPVGSGTIEWPTRPYAVPDTYDALVAKSTVLVIPGVISGKNVCAVSDDAFAGDIALNYVTVEGAVGGTTIGSRAFQNCADLKYVTLGNVIDIGEYAFSGCAMESIVIPASVTSIGTGAFEGVSVVFGYTSVAEEHAASINAAYVNISRIATELEIVSLPSKLSFSVGEELDLTGLLLTSGGDVVSLNDCFIESLPSNLGNHLLHIQYLDACITLPIEVKVAAVSGSDKIELLTIEKPNSQTVILTGKVTSTAEDAIIVVAFYKTTGQLIDISIPTPDETGTFTVEHSITDTGSLRLFFLDKESGYSPLTPSPSINLLDILI